MELAKLARGNSKDKIRALALLSQHHGLLDGSWLHRDHSKGPIEINVRHETAKALNEITKEIESDVEAFNRTTEANNKRIERQWKLITEKYSHSPEATAALTEMRAAVYEQQIPLPTNAGGFKDAATANEQFARNGKSEHEVEIIPPPRQLPAAPIERMMAEVIEVEPAITPTIEARLNTQTSHAATGTRQGMPLSRVVNTQTMLRSTTAERRFTC